MSVFKLLKVIQLIDCKTILNNKIIFKNGYIYYDQCLILCILEKWYILIQ